MSPTSPVRRLDADKTYGRAVNAFDAVAWRPPSTARFDERAADNAEVSDAPLREIVARLPGWVVVAGGGLVAALMGAVLGGAWAL